MTAALCGSRELALMRRERVVAHTRAGWSAPSIASAEGVTTRTVQRIRRDAGLAVTPPGPFSDAEMLTAAELLSDGCSYNEVARTLGRGVNTIRKHFPGMGWPPDAGGRYGSGLRWARERARRSGVRL